MKLYNRDFCFAFVAVLAILHGDADKHKVEKACSNGRRRRRRRRCYYRSATVVRFDVFVGAQDALLKTEADEALERRRAAALAIGAAHYGLESGAEFSLVRARIGVNELEFAVVHVIFGETADELVGRVDAQVALDLSEAALVVRLALRLEADDAAPLRGYCLAGVVVVVIDGASGGCVFAEAEARLERLVNDARVY